MVDLGRIGIVGGAGWLGTAMAKAPAGFGMVPLNAADLLVSKQQARKLRDQHQTHFPKLHPSVQLRPSPQKKIECSPASRARWLALKRPLY